MLSRIECLTVLDFKESMSPSTTEIKKRYYKLAKKIHPDKGGKKEDFQKLLNAYEYLIKNDKEHIPSSSATTYGQAQTSYQSSYDNSEEPYDSENDYYRWHYDYFNQPESNYENFEEQYEKERKERAKQRRFNVKNMIDYRDTVSPRKKRKRSTVCHYCGTRDGITKERADNDGLNWNEYSSHEKVKSGEFATCWACLKAHTTVLTEKKAISKFKVLAVEDANGPYGPYREFFWTLKKKNKSFTYQPKTPHATYTLKSRYYWVDDCKEEALARGWKPRKKRTTREKKKRKKN